MNAKASFRSFEESTEADWKIIQNDFPVTQAMAAANIIEQLKILERDDGGFPVTRLEHSLQTATRAAEDGRDDEYVLCALLHDIGDTLAPMNHPSIAAGMPPFAPSPAASAVRSSDDAVAPSGLLGRVSTATSQSPGSGRAPASNTSCPAARQAGACSP